jgi:hypothetical protein
MARRTCSMVLSNSSRCRFSPARAVSPSVFIYAIHLVAFSATMMPISTSDSCIAWPVHSLTPSTASYNLILNVHLLGGNPARFLPQLPALSIYDGCFRRHVGRSCSKSATGFPHPYSVGISMSSIVHSRDAIDRYRPQAPWAPAHRSMFSTRHRM